MHQHKYFEGECPSYMRDFLEAVQEGDLTLRNTSKT